MEKKLNRFTACFAFVMNVEFNHLRGFAPCETKMLCIYVAKRTLGIDSRILAAYYRLDRQYMEKKLHDIAIKLLIDKDLQNKLGNVRLYWELESGKIV